MQYSSLQPTSALLVGLISLALVGPTNATLTITEVDLANDKVELVNLTANTVDASSWFLCNRVNGSPFYPSMASAAIDTNLSTATSLVVAPGEILVLEKAGLFPDANGELGTYNVNSFGSTSAIEDYIAWGGGGFRDGVAAGAGIWAIDEFVDVSGIMANETIQLTFGQPGDSEQDYFIDASTLGAFGPSAPTNAPLIRITSSSPGFAQISWTPDTPGFVLQEADSLAPTSWTNSISGTTNPVVIPATTPAKFYRLNNQP